MIARIVDVRRLLRGDSDRPQPSQSTLGSETANAGAGSMGVPTVRWSMGLCDPNVLSALSGTLVGCGDMLVTE